MTATHLRELQLHPYLHQRCDVRDVQAPFIDCLKEEILSLVGLAIFLCQQDQATTLQGSHCIVE